MAKNIKLLVEIVELKILKSQNLLNNAAKITEPAVGAST
jgi:hypothetical protein